MCSVPLIGLIARSGGALVRVALLHAPGGPHPCTGEGAKRKGRRWRDLRERVAPPVPRGAKRRNLDLRTLNFRTTKQLSLLSRFAVLSPVEVHAEQPKP